MRLFPGVGSVLLALGLSAGGVRAGDWTLPPVDGELAGELAPTMLAGAPPLHWKVSLQKAGDAKRLLRLTLEGEGTHLVVEGGAAVNTGDGEWRIAAAEVDAQRWSAAMAAKLGGAIANVTAQGRVVVTGAGAIRGGRFTGVVAIRAAGVSLGDATAGWKLEDVSIAGEFAFDAGAGSWQSTKPAEIAIGRISTKRFGAQNLKATVRLKERATAELLAASIEIAGGNVVAAPAAIPLNPVDVQLDLRFTHIGLQDIAQFVPNAVAEAYGLVDGSVHLGWTPAGGFQVGRGQLALRDDAPASVRLVQMPGVITGNIPEKALEFYQGLDQVERGLIPIEASSLIVTYTPSGDAEGRQAYVHLAGTYPHARAPLDLTFNFRGPIGPLLKMSTDSRLHFGGSESFVASLRLITTFLPAMKRALCCLMPVLAVNFGGCLSVKPIEVKPIHVTVDVNVKVDRALDDFFGDLDKRSTTLNVPKS